MYNTPNKAISGVFTNSPPWELKLIKSLYFINLGLLLIALIVLLLDLMSFFNANYFPLEVSILSLSLMSVYFLHKGLKKAAANLINFLPIPIYFLLVSPGMAIFSPLHSYFFHILLLSLGMFFLLVYADTLIQIFVFLLISLASILYHIFLTDSLKYIFRFFWSSQEIVLNPVLLLLLIGSITIMLFNLFRGELKRLEKNISDRKVNLQNVMGHFPLGIIQIRINRDEFGEKSGLTIDYINPAFEEFFGLKNHEVKGIAASVIFQKIFRNEVDWQELFQNRVQDSK